MARELLMATHNAGKVRELRELLAGSGWTVRGLPEGTPEFPEDGATFADNARGKALFYARHVGMAALADDSGLEVDALDGAPGVYSARFIDPQITQQERNRGLLEMLEGVEDSRRSARFVCHLVLALPGRVVHESTGEAVGTITTAPSGGGGFGYDPVFRPEGCDRTFAEISRAEKSSLSHRGAAVRAMIEFLETWDPPGVVS